MASSVSSEEPKRRHERLRFDSDDEGELIDKTEALILHSKRTERRRKKERRKASRSSPQAKHLLDLPFDLLLDILTLCRPSDIFCLLRVCKPLRDFILEQESMIAKYICQNRYACLEKCFRVPVLMTEVDNHIHPFLQDPDRQEILTIHKKPYQHVPAPDPSLVCTCLTCMLRWNALSLALDFSHWQEHLDKGEPLPTIARGQSPVWNRELLSEHRSLVTRALYSPLWHARILEAHLGSTTRSIRRHGANKGNKRRRFRMTDRDAESGSDAFLEAAGPPSLDFPFHRDNYYMLEAYLPNRAWNAEKRRWMYMPADQHDKDLLFVVRWGEWRKRVAAEKAAAQTATAQKDMAQRDTP